MNQNESLYLTDLESMLQEILDALDSEDLLPGDPLLLAAERLLDKGLEGYESTFEDAD